MRIFNPTMVRLRRRTSPSSGGKTFVFSIPLWCDCDHTQLLPPRPFCQFSIPLWCDCDVVLREVSVTLPTFQSHYGAIATHPSSMPTVPTSFQSHYGAIATLRSPRLHQPTSIFNPTMVRLRHKRSQALRSVNADFQSHYGAIATR